MKRIHAVLLILLLMLSFTACGKAGQAERAIADIGTVTTESESAIAEAEQLYDALSPRQQARVDNLDILTAARAEHNRLMAEVDVTVDAISSLENIALRQRQELENAEGLYAALTEDQKSRVSNADLLTEIRKEFDRQSQLVQKAVDLIDSIGEVTLDSKDILASARRAYQDALNEGLGVYVQHIESILTDGEERYQYLQLEDRLNAARDMYNRGVYQPALELALVLSEDCQDTDLHDNVSVLIADCYLGLAWDAFDADDLENAFYQLRHSDACYPSEERPESYTQLQEQLTAELKKRRPFHGEVLVSKAGYGGSRHELTIYAPDEYDACIKLESVYNPKNYCLLYVRAGQRLSFGVSEGTYYVKYAVGEYWFGKDALFGQEGSYVQAKEPVDFISFSDGHYRYYISLTITIQPGFGSSEDALNVPPEEF